MSWISRSKKPVVKHDSNIMYGNHVAWAKVSNENRRYINFAFRVRELRSNETIVDNAFHCVGTRLCAAWLIPVIAESAFIAAVPRKSARHFTNGRHFYIAIGKWNAERNVFFFFSPRLGFLDNNFSEQRRVVSVWKLARARKKLGLMRAQFVKYSRTWYSFKIRDVNLWNSLGSVSLNLVQNWSTRQPRFVIN